MTTFIVMAAGAGGIYWAVKIHQRHEIQSTYLTWEMNHLLPMLKTHFFLFGKLPENWQAFEASGAYQISDAEIDGFHRAYPDAPAYSDMEKMQISVFAEAKTVALDQLASWNLERAAALKPLEDLKANLRGQLDLFFDPKFDTRVTLSFTDELQRQGISQKAVRDFLHAARLLRDADEFINHPIGPIDDARLNDVLKLRAEEQYSKSHDDLEKFRDEILRQAQAHPVSQP